ncbi:MAG: sigma-70 family RNA polymerase sigma factor [Bacteroidia bacterium]|nr:sigma-70 family RNA polymerase sigma factor [Bacteroidota bacterium]MBP9082790.1 sigma-70 family RNA polymerase sigma factor [Bacteroidia bacterium]
MSPLIHSNSILQSKSQHSEDDLVVLLQKGSEEAFNLLYDRYSPTLYGIVVKIVRDEEVAQDVLQDGFLKIWKNISNYDKSKGTLFTWLLNIVRNTAIDYLRSGHVKNQIRIDDPNVSIAEPESVNISHDHIGLKEAIQTMKPEHKIVLETIYFKGYTQSEASKALKLPIGTLKTRVRSAIITLRELFKEKSGEY